MSTYNRWERNQGITTILVVIGKQASVMPRGFILHPTYRIEKGRPVIHLFGKLESGETFVVRNDRYRPYFFIKKTDTSKARKAGAGEIRSSGYRTMAGIPVSRLVFDLPTDTPELRKSLTDADIQCFEADIPFATRFLIDHDIRGGIEIAGISKKGRLIDRIYENPDIKSADVMPHLKILSLDIETNPSMDRLLSVALAGDETDEVHLVCSDMPVGNLPDYALAYPDEVTLLNNLHRRIRQIDPDIITGWNVIDFDLYILEKLVRKYRIPFTFGRADIPAKLRLDQSLWGASRAILPGRVVLDGLALLRGAFIRTDDYRLETVAQEALGRGKTITSETIAGKSPRGENRIVGNKADEILRLHREDPAAFVEYNLTDARLVLDILDHFQLIPLAIKRSLLTGMPMDRVSASIASFDFLYLSEMKKRGIVAPSVDHDIPIHPTAGGYVLNAIPGIYRNILVFDYRSLYPNLIRTFRLDPMNLVSNTNNRYSEVEFASGHIINDPGYVTAPNGAKFKKEGGILPALLDRFFPEREKALVLENHIAASAIKIAMNSLYGVLATPRCRFYSSETANAITQFGQMILRWTKTRVEHENLRVLYGDTDSIFVDGKFQNPDEAQQLGRDLAGRISSELNRHIEKYYAVESFLELRFEKIYHRFFLPGLRHSLEGSKKRYAGVVYEDGERRIVFTGMESVRRDWTQLAKLFQHDLLDLVFRLEEHSPPKEIEEMIRNFVDKLRNGELNELLVYHKALRKNIDEYTKTTPPHVKAAKLLGKRAGRIISYVITIKGPQPVQMQTDPHDYEHYVEKQIRPVAETILQHLNISWERIWSRQDELPL
ncbi:MAG: DNA polymerase II [Candidatus Eisenbacteria bacterium]|nr:DNA polymerase II [Candidatus Eisenbacteria bacterium]MBU1949197.1 DNA polymerase II [Candidatus Eisenbacteria bacterium]